MEITACQMQDRGKKEGKQGRNVMLLSVRDGMVIDRK
ncbi:hypothetical protein KS4_34010 [Poriferisphaera corsica]|uniref:Uncharacterized protein n=1 Tax=Poriferisphaera corsica TaxID=2528020 RepID=A0A517YYL9_9BACT|nr:hypothetical protein KS4_34010 [Poriferisphaera corsica]